MVSKMTFKHTHQADSAVPGPEGCWMLQARPMSKSLPIGDLSRVVTQVFIFMTGIFVSSWIGGALLSVGEWIIKKLPLVKHIYSAAKQVGSFTCTEGFDTW